MIETIEAVQVFVVLIMFGVGVLASVAHMLGRLSERAERILVVLLMVGILAIFSLSEVKFFGGL